MPWTPHSRLLTNFFAPLVLVALASGSAVAQDEGGGWGLQRLNPFRGSSEQESTSRPTGRLARGASRTNSESTSSGSWWGWGGSDEAVVEETPESGALTNAWSSIASVPRNVYNRSQQAMTRTREATQGAWTRTRAATQSAWQRTKSALNPWGQSTTTATPTRRFGSRTAQRKESDNTNGIWPSWMLGPEETVESEKPASVSEWLGNPRPE